MFDKQYDIEACFNNPQKARDIYAQLHSEISPRVFLDNPSVTMRHAWYDVYTALSTGIDVDILEATTDAYCACDFNTEDSDNLDKLDKIVHSIYHYVHLWDN